MALLRLLHRLGPTDARLVTRDRALLWALVVPVLAAALIRWGLPPLSEWLWVQAAFDLEPYHALIAGAYVLVAPSMVGFVVGFLLLDERDDHVLDALRVTPVPLNDLFLYRVGMPVVLGTGITLAAYPWLGMTPLPAAPLVVASALGACSAPTIALFLVAYADNKVSGLALAKLMSAVSNLALVAWFVPMPWQLVAGVLPSYWPMKVVWQAAAGDPWAAVAAAGLCINVIAIALFAWRFRVALES